MWLNREISGGGVRGFLGRGKSKPSSRASKRGSRRWRERKKVVRRITTLEKPPKLEWIKTGIPGFDELFNRGIPKGKNILIAGGPGTGKTIFCLQTLYNAVRKGRDCLYITFEESPANLT